jgi:Glyoxalase/Bleomycin resistance protein/Dioxygenase superfamily
MARTTRLGIFLLAAAPLAAQVPEVYRSVDRVTWIVDNIDRVALGWEKVGFMQIEMRQDIELPVTFRGQPTKAKVRMASGHLGDLRVDWIQPLGGVNAFTEYQKKHRSGIFSLIHHVPDLEAEKARLGSLGVEILQSESAVTYFDTEPRGKYVLGVTTAPADPPPSVPSDRRIVQFAFTAKDLKPIGEYWAKLGLGNMAFNKGNLSDVEYHGTPVAIEQQFGWQRNRKVVYEWLAPITTPNTFDDHMARYGEGIHHLAVNVPDMPKAIEQWKAAGYKVASTGAWGEKGKPGSGRFAYVDTEPIGGVIMELLWQFRQ